MIPQSKASPDRLLFECYNDQLDVSDAVLYCSKRGLQLQIDDVERAYAELGRLARTLNEWFGTSTEANE
jgi:hypothetical protein